MNIVSTASRYSYSVLNRDCKCLMNEYSFIKKIKIGKSVLGKELFCLRFGEGDKKVFVNASHHGNEWITSILVMRMLEEMCYLYRNDMSYRLYNIKEIYKKVSLYVCPMVNPDGVDLSVSGLTDDLPPIIKTRLISYNGESKDFKDKWQANINGVDLNHNYDAGFSKGKAFEAREKIFSPGPTRYSGAYAFSEPETVSIKNFMLNLSPDIAVAYHSQGEEIYYDYEGKACQEARVLAHFMAEISGYKACSPEGMASYSGFKDWIIEKFNIPAFTIEVGLGKNPLSLSQFDDILQKNFPMLLFLLNK